MQSGLRADDQRLRGEDQRSVENRGSELLRVQLDSLLSLPEMTKVTIILLLTDLQLLNHIKLKDYCRRNILFYYCLLIIQKGDEKLKEHEACVSKPKSKEQTYEDRIEELEVALAEEKKKNADLQKVCC